MTKNNIIDWTESIPYKFWQKHDYPSIYRSSKLWEHTTLNGQGLVARLLNKNKEKK